MHTEIDAILNRFAGDKALNVGSELRQIFGTGGSPISFQCPVYD
jgi:hypothetical protein